MLHRDSQEWTRYHTERTLERIKILRLHNPHQTILEDDKPVFTDTNILWITPGAG